MKAKLIIIVTASILIVTIILLFYLQKSNEKEIVNRFRAQQLVASRQLAREIESYLKERAKGISHLSLFSSLQNRDVKKAAEEIETFFSYVKKNHIKGISVYDGTGTIVYSTGENTVGRSCEQLDFFRWATKRENKEKQFISPLIRKTDDTTAAPHYYGALIAAPIYNDGKDPQYPKPTHKFVGIITATINLEELLTEFLPLVSSFAGKEHVWILDSNGNVLFQSAHAEMVMKSIRQPDETCMQCHISTKHYGTILSERQGTTEYELKEMPKKLASFSTIQLMNISWKIVLSISFEEVSGFVNNNLYLTFILIGIITVTLIGGSLFIFRSYRLKAHAEAETKQLRQKRALEEKIVESEERYRTLSESAITGVYLIQDRLFRYVNPVLASVFGYDVDEIVDKLGPLDLTAPEDRDVVAENIRKRVEGIAEHIRYSFKGLCKDGRRIDVEVYGARIDYKGKPAVLGTLLDITERKRAEYEIISQKNKFAQLFENSPIAIALLDDQDKIVHINESFSVLFGYFLEEIKGLPLNDVIVPPELKEEAESYSDQTRAGNQINKESYRKKKDGTLVYVQIIGIPVTVNDKTTGIYGMYVDLTQRKDAEEKMKSAKELAVQSDKLKSEFLAQMSHEIRTPLNAIIGNVDYLDSSIGEKMDPPTRGCFDSIRLASKRIIRTIDLILDVSELQTGVFKPSLKEIDINSKVLNKLFNEFRPAAVNKGLDLIFKCETKESKVIADEYSITQIFANLIDNAVKYTKKGKVEILLTKNEGGDIIVEVRDTGIGMNKDFLPHIFEPFVQEEKGYTRTFDGNGLGLSLVKGYCDIINASIEIESEKNAGSTFRVIFKQK